MLIARSGKARIAAVFTAAVVSLGIIAGPASAQPTQQQGLVNVAVTDNTVQVPIGVAANVCGVTAAVLANQISTNSVDCSAISNATAFSQGNGGGGGAQQNGLVNIALTGNTVQIPVSAAANVCGVGVAVLAQFVNTSDIACTARSRGSAQA
jgi:hypothetical protein